MRFTTTIVVLLSLIVAHANTASHAPVTTETTQEKTTTDELKELQYAVYRPSIGQLHKIFYTAVEMYGEEQAKFVREKIRENVHRYELENDIKLDEHVFDEQRAPNTWTLYTLSRRSCPFEHIYRHSYFTTDTWPHDKWSRVYGDVPGATCVCQKSGTWIAERPLRVMSTFFLVPGCYEPIIRMKFPDKLVIDTTMEIAIYFKWPAGNEGERYWKKWDLSIGTMRDLQQLQKDKENKWLNLRFPRIITEHRTPAVECAVSTYNFPGIMVDETVMRLTMSTAAIQNPSVVKFNGRNEPMISYRYKR